MAKFYGDEVCVSYRKRERRRGIINRDEQKCESECFDDEEEETYFSDLFCSSHSCGGGYNKLKFELTSAGKELKAKQMTIAAVLSLLGIGYLLWM